MGRFLAGAASCLLLVSGAILLWQGRAQQASAPPPQPRIAAPATDIPMTLAPIPQAPTADPKSKEEKRFGRADKNDDGRISLAELVEPRRKAFAKVDKNGNGSLSFEEYAVKTIDKFDAANADKDGWLTPAEYAVTAPKPPKRQRCSC